MKNVLFLLALSTVAWGQAPPAQPALTASTTIAIRAIAQQRDTIQRQINEMQNAIAAVDQDVRKQVPGHHLNPQTLEVEKDAPAPTQPSKPAEKK